jgi:glycerophosphoryl diester phosphodiesterase
MSRRRPVVIAHRGASGYLPEHTFAAKAMAYAMGADLLEQDLHLTRDGEVVVIHDTWLDELTDVAERFPGRQRPDGRFLVLDFTLDELRSLRFTERFTRIDGRPAQVYPGRFPTGTGRFEIHTLADELALVDGLNHATGGRVGLYPEIKVPWLHRREGMDLSTAALTVLRDHGYTSRDRAVFVQCFDPLEVRRLRQEVMPALGVDLRLVQLIGRPEWRETWVEDADAGWVPYDDGWLLEPGAMARVAEVADGIGPAWSMVLAPDPATGRVAVTPLVAEAHAHGLTVHPYTLRADQLPEWAADLDDLHARLFLDAGVDGVFTDFPDRTVGWLRAHHLR